MRRPGRRGSPRAGRACEGRGTVRDPGKEYRPINGGGEPTMAQRSKNRRTAAPRPDVCHPHLEALEGRLSLGDAILGTVLGVPLVEASLAAVGPASGAAKGAADTRPEELVCVSTASLSRAETDVEWAVLAVSPVPASLRQQPSEASNAAPPESLGEPAGIPSREATPAFLHDGASITARPFGRSPSTAPRAAADHASGACGMPMSVRADHSADQPVPAAVSPGPSAAPAS